MPNYNYGALSPQDFEEVSRDLLQAEWEVALEAFKEGRDSGIDLRYATSPDNTVIVQCKHYAKSGFAALLRHLRDSELPKIEKVKPNRYVVVTTVALSPSNKQSILQTLTPYVKSPSDVLGVDDLDGLLAKHPNVERANFKLWLTSTSVIGRILHNAEVCHTEFEVERIRQKLPLFVQNQTYPQANEILRTARILVVSGPPGIGKTTLAEMLLYSSLEEGYEPVVIQGDIAEGKKLYRREARQIFYYDDFLGQTFLGDRREYLGQNQDKAVVDFMEMVRRSPDSKFILTTREHILSSAIRLSERLGGSTLIRDRIVLKLGHYSFGDRARILYNHLYFSELSTAHKRETLRGDFFLRVVRHPHFNPRLIEWLADLSRVGSVPAADYQSYVEDLLDNPERIWDHAYRTQIPEAGRCLLLALYTDGGHSLLGLASCFAELRTARAKRYNQQTEPNEFDANLKILEGGFVAIGTRGVDYLNPSIKGYVGSVIIGDPETYFDIFESAIRFKQIATLWRLRKEVGSPSKQLLPQHYSTAFISRLTALAEGPVYAWTTSAEGKTTGHRIDYDTEERLRFLAEFCNVEHAEPSLDQVYDVMERLIAKWSPQMVDLWDTPELVREMATLNRFVAGRGASIRQLVLEKLLDALPHARSYHWRGLIDLPESTPGWRQRNGQKFFEGLRSYMNGGWRDDFDNCEDLYDKRRLAENLSELAQRKKRSRFFAAPLRGVHDEIAAIADDEKKPELGTGSPDQVLPSSSLSESDVRSMFQTLLLDGS
ncbi:nSTAND3 domain-containing NTPase [Burkholderia vietnamiensis]|uniref:nSTAND3 domain-containing NTPase n=1 Tax=Burkholderia vietnamiensis TaxID=60552 RepID=UPI001CF4E92A|nr:restriction endonuclease [Burkholderia vietnamiensis]MCA8290783.1 restriction endonuclease [Burkholderia vietnamiensis]